MTRQILTGDCVAVLATLPAASQDACVTDPPYGLEFMGKEWDSFGARGENWPSGMAHKVPDNTPRFTRMPVQARVAFQDFSAAWAREVFRVLKPGAHLLAFGGTRTYHRLVCAIEDAGFEIRDQLAWIFGSGFPKSLNVSKAIDDAAGATREVVGYDVSRARPNRTGMVMGETPYDRSDNGATQTVPATDSAKQWEGWGTALKPAYEPIVLARKPLVGTVASNILQHGTGALNIDGCRIGTDSTIRANNAAVEEYGTVRHGASSFNKAGTHGSDFGRWPANLVHDGSEDVLAAFPDAPGQGGIVTGLEPSDKMRNVFGLYGDREPAIPRGDVGSAARFFYCAKASRAERDFGCAALPERTAATTVGRDPESAGAKNPRAGAGRGAGASIERCRKCGCDGGGGRRVSSCLNGEPHEFEAVAVLGGVRNTHPTVKPVALMRWLVRLVTPPGGTVIDPFLGSGTTGMAAAYEGFNFIGIEREADYIPIAQARIAAAEHDAAEIVRIAREQPSLFDGPTQQELF